MPEALQNDYQKFIHASRYARWRDEDGRRETWGETVDRYVDYVSDAVEEHNGYTLPTDLKSQLRDGIFTTKTMPSMRGLMTAGPALDRDSTCIYNCSYVPVQDLRTFDEAMYILMCGTGVGYSVESRYVSQIPAVPSSFDKVDTTIVVEDSKAGWAYGLRELMENLWAGKIPSWDLSKIRPAGARLKTFGGRASGPEPLDRLFNFVVGTVVEAAGRQITDVEAHDIMCKIAEIVVVGGVRRSAMISLTDLSSNGMATAKHGSWWENASHRGLANISAVYEDTPSFEEFWTEWTSLKNSGSGERGVFSRAASKNIVKKYGRRDPNYEFGTNPCSEIILRPFGFCNLTEVVVRAEDTLGTLMEKVQIATYLGTLQASFTRFDYLRDEWRRNAEEEALLGVSMTGQMGHAILNGSKGTEVLAEWLDTLRDVAVEANAKMADAIGINRAAAITCVKPSGTVSQLVLCSSGMHTWHDYYYIRTVRQDNKDPLTQFMQDAGIPSEPDVRNPDYTTVFSFPIAAPRSAMTRNSLTAIEHLEIWLAYQRHWCEHKPSITISVKENEWNEVGTWVYKHLDELSGVSFLPYDGGTYQQAPYQTISEDEYIDRMLEMPKNIDWELLRLYESEDTTTGSQDLACVAGACEIVGSADTNDIEHIAV